MLGNSGSKPVRTHEEIEVTIKAAPQEDRQTLRSLASHSGTSKTTIMRHMGVTKKFKAPHQAPTPTTRSDCELALRAAKSKRFNKKVMFLAAVARPRYDPHLR
ncbi:hypothetical protein H257_07583 [Aphanomyces astaci]|uniref:Transposase Tc1-like domain-containing protein n=1 Tax=Aphanomyces astaci TaxID=112090 RepID=W4GGD9_APHAT|nr:hypothetical protein H257_07583 [Aphanomyces astaci]ETV78740.1 hypothetical protein H257_07583 [Aphanomyces astaci]|eukprot:XP_009831459.1 hypothetical protein H257_07583 [Aphanomyces astaci]